MVGDSTEDAIQVDSFEWTDENIEHVLESRHHATVEDVEEVRRNSPRLFLNLPLKSGTHVMIGPNLRGQFFYVVLVKTETPGRWRPITAYRVSKARGQRVYNAKKVE